MIIKLDGFFATVEDSNVQRDWTGDRVFVSSGCWNLWWPVITYLRYCCLEVGTDSWEMSSGLRNNLLFWRKMVCVWRRFRRSILVFNEEIFYLEKDFVDLFFGEEFFFLEKDFVELFLFLRNASILQMSFFHFSLLSFTSLFSFSKIFHSINRSGPESTDVFLFRFEVINDVRIWNPSWREEAAGTNDGKSYWRLFKC